MSLILEALKKLDREKKTPDRGFLVVGAVPWPAPRARQTLPTVIVLIAGAAAGAALWLGWRAAVRDEARPPVASPSTLSSFTAPPATPRLAPGQPVATPVMVAPPATLPLVVPRPRGEEKSPAMERPAALKPAASTEPGAGLQLQAISQHEGKPVAVLNNRVVHEGDTFDGVTIVRIGTDEVEIEAQGRRRTLRF